MTSSFTSLSKKFNCRLLSIIFIFLLGCSNRLVSVGTVKGEFSSAPAVVAKKLDLFKKNNLKAEIVVYDNRFELIEAIKKKEVNTAYLNIKDAITLLAKNQADFRIIAVALRVNFQPEAVLVTSRRDLEPLIIAVHREVTRLLASRSEPAFSITFSWTNKKEFPNNTTFDAGMDKAELITVLEELRREGKITPEEAENTANRLILEEGSD